MNTILPEEIENQKTVPAIETNADQQENEIKTKASELIKKQNELDYLKLTIKDIEKESKSEYLKKLEDTKKKLAAQIKEEKIRINNDLIQDSNYSDSWGAAVCLRNHVKNLRNELRESLNNYRPGEQLSMFDLEIDGAYYRLQSQKSVKLFINGKENK